MGVWGPQAPEKPLLVECWWRQSLHQHSTRKILRGFGSSSLVPIKSIAYIPRLSAVVHIQIFERKRSYLRNKGRSGTLRRACPTRCRRKNAVIDHGTS